jgi:hypothetical protein
MQLTDALKNKKQEFGGLVLCESKRVIILKGNYRMPHLKLDIAYKREVFKMYKHIYDTLFKPRKYFLLNNMWYVG